MKYKNLKYLIYIVIPTITVFLCRILKIVQGEKNEEVVFGIMFGIFLDIIFYIIDKLNSRNKKNYNLMDCLKNNNLKVNMIMKIKYFLFAFFSLLFIVVDKFILTKTFGWLEIIPFIISVMLLIFSIVKLYQLFNLSKISKIILTSISIVLILWFSMMGIDYKRHKNLYSPLFNIGYEVKEDYDMSIQSGHIYKNKSTFYLFGIKLDEVYVEED